MNFRERPISAVELKSLDGNNVLKVGVIALTYELTVVTRSHKGFVKAGGRVIELIHGMVACKLSR